MFPRFLLPAEYLAAVCINVVHPVNWMSAAAVFEASPRTRDLADGVEVGQLSPVTARKMFAIMVEYGTTLDSDEIATVRAALQNLYKQQASKVKPS